MTNMRTLITSWEAVKYGPVQKEFPTAYICNHIKRVELKLFRKCFLGKVLYDKLIENLVPIDTAKAYDINTTYSKGALICYEGCILESTKDTNSTHPDHSEDLDPCWIFAKKFKSSCYQLLWECHLRYWLAFEIIYTSIRYATFPMGALGMVRVNNDQTGIQTVDYKSFASTKKEIKNDANDELENMYEWMIEQQKEGTCDFSDSEKVKSACADTKCVGPKPRRRRRFYFKK